MGKTFKDQRDATRRRVVDHRFKKKDKRSSQLEKLNEKEMYCGNCGGDWPNECVCPIPILGSTRSSERMGISSRLLSQSGLRSDNPRGFGDSNNDTRDSPEGHVDVEAGTTEQGPR